jgi:hypothetical protein
MVRRFKALFIWVFVGMLFLQGEALGRYARDRLIDLSARSAEARIDGRLSHEDPKTHRMSHALRYAFNDHQGRPHLRLFPLSETQAQPSPAEQTIDVVYLSWWPGLNVPRRFYREHAPLSDLSRTLMVLQGWLSLIMLFFALRAIARRVIGPG